MSRKTTAMHSNSTIQSVTDLRVQWAVALLLVMCQTGCSIVRITQNDHTISHSLHFITQPALATPSSGVALIQTSSFGAFRTASTSGVGLLRESLAYAVDPTQCGAIIVFDTVPATPPAWLVELQKTPSHAMCIASLSQKENSYEK